MTYDYEKPGNIPVILASLRERASRTSPAPVPPEPGEPVPDDPDPAPLPSLRMVRNDKPEPVLIGSPPAGLVEIGQVSFDVAATMTSGSAGGEYSVGAIDASNRFRFYFSGRFLQIARLEGGQDVLVGSPSLRDMTAGETLRLRIVVTDGKAMLAVFFGGEQVYAGGPFTAFPGGTKFAWRNDVAPAAADVSIASTDDPIRLDHADFVGLSDLRAKVPVYFSTLASQPEPTGLQIRQRRLDGSIITGWQDALLIASARAGQYDAVAPTPYTGTLGRLVEVDVRHKAMPALAATVRLYYPKPMKIGQNLSNIFSPSRPLRVFSNMLVQSQTILMTEANYPPIGPNRAGHTDELGNVISANSDKWTWYPLPDQRNIDVLHTLTWDGGPIDIDHYLRVESLGWLGASPMQLVGPNKIQWRNRGDRRIARGAAQAARFLWKGIDPANPPKNMKLVTEYDDPAETFTKPFLDSLRSIDGWLRFMDNLGINGPVYYEGQLDWSKRARVNMICAGGLAYEHIVEMANKSGRQVLLNLLPNFAYSAQATDHFDRMMDLLLFGIGSDVPSTGLGRALAVEAFNERWNDGLNRGKDSFAYLQMKGQENGRTQAHEAVWCANWLYARLQTRYANDNDKLDLKFGYQMGASDSGFMAAQPGWAELRQRLTGGLVAPYCPGDPNAGFQPGQQPPALDPVSVSDWLIERLHSSLIPNLRATVHAIAEQGLEVDVYEVNVAMKAIADMVAEQIWDLYGSAAFYDFWLNHFLPRLAHLVGGNQCLYSDTGVVLGPNAEMWTMMPLPNSTFNGAWDACVNWTAERRLAA